MKKVFVSMMLAGALLLGGTANAQNKADGATGASVQKENVEKGNKGDKKGGKGMRGDRGPRVNPFDGVQLTNDQQQRLQVLQQGLGPVELNKEQMEKIPENPNLTAEQKKQLAEERKAKKLEAKKNYLNGVKEILTPDQYVIFLENVYLYSPQDQGYSGRPGDRKGNFGGKAGKVKKDQPAKQQ
ncbi:MAG: hypothetical protein J1E16_02795 [Muribaculaceae bacterium]|nr:hypothetical protein [Muribaculaceae bacterium]